MGPWSALVTGAGARRASLAARAGPAGQGTRARGARAVQASRGNTGGWGSPALDAGPVGGCGRATALLLTGLALGWVIARAVRRADRPVLPARLGERPVRGGRRADHRRSGRRRRGLQDAYRAAGRGRPHPRMAAVTQHGSTAQARSARRSTSAGAARPGITRVLHAAPGRLGWKVVWRPVGHRTRPAPGLRLAVVRPSRTGRRCWTPRASRSRRSPGLHRRRRPGPLEHPAQTAERLARATGLVASQDARRDQRGAVARLPRAGQAQPGQLPPAERQPLRRVPGLIVDRQRLRLFDSIAPTCPAASAPRRPALQQDGDRRTGRVPRSGCPGCSRRSSAGSSARRRPRSSPRTPPATWFRCCKAGPASTGTDVRTTINASVQQAANKALESAGRLRGDRRHRARPRPRCSRWPSRHARGMPAVSPLAGRYQPGQAFTIVSTAALLNTGFGLNTPIPCSALEPGRRPDLRERPARSRTWPPPFRGRLRERLRHRLRRPVAAAVRQGPEARRHGLRPRRALAAAAQPRSPGPSGRRPTRPSSPRTPSGPARTGQPAGHGARRRGGPVGDLAPALAGHRPAGPGAHPDRSVRAAGRLRAAP